MSNLQPSSWKLNAESINAFNSARYKWVHFVPPRERPVLFDQSEAGTCTLSVGYVTNSWEQCRCLRLTDNAEFLNSTDEGLERVSSEFVTYVILGNTADVHASLGKPRV